jgi:uncharacterized membrane protein
MKRIMYWLAVVAVIIQACACIAMGFEIFVATHLNPDVIKIEAYLIGVCLIVEIICNFYRVHSSK